MTRRIIPYTKDATETYSQVPVVPSLRARGIQPSGVPRVNWRNPITAGAQLLVSGSSPVNAVTGNQAAVQTLGASTAGIAGVAPRIAVTSDQTTLAWLGEIDVGFGDGDGYTIMCLMQHPSTFGGQTNRAAMVINDSGAADNASRVGSFLLFKASSEVAYLSHDNWGNNNSSPDSTTGFATAPGMLTGKCTVSTAGYNTKLYVNESKNEASAFGYHRQDTRRAKDVWLSVYPPDFSGDTYGNGNGAGMGVFFAGVWARELAHHEVISVVRNAWQVFA